MSTRPFGPVRRVGLRFVRHNDANETILFSPAQETEATKELLHVSRGVDLHVVDGQIWIDLP